MRSDGDEEETSWLSSRPNNEERTQYRRGVLCLSTFQRAQGAAKSGL
jgi:hypothetical protein